MKSSHSINGPSTEAARITHNVNLNFEIGTCNINSGPANRNNRRNEINESSARDSNDNQNGKSEDISHGENHDDRAGYSSSNTSDEGKPSGIRPINNCANRIQERQSNDYTPGDEAIRQPVKVDGKPGGISHSLRKSTLAEPTPVLMIHPECIRYCNPNDIDTQEKINLMLQPCYPKDDNRFSGYQAIQASEKLSIEILQTCDPPSMSLDESRKFNSHVRKINTWRRRNQIPALPGHLLEVEMRKLLPCCPSFLPDVHEMDAYKSRLRLMMREVQIIEWIVRGYIPEMTPEDESFIQQDLSVLNPLREEKNYEPLDIYKSFDEHFIDTEEPKDTKKKNRIVIDSHPANSDDSDSDSNNDSDVSMEDGTTTNVRSEDRESLAETNRRWIESLPDKEDALCVASQDKSSSMKVPDNDKEVEIHVDRQLKTFLQSLNAMTYCPITHSTMVEPLVGVDKQVYERSAISKWLEDKRTSPFSRLPMEMHCLMEDVTMKKLIGSMKECKITDYMIKNLKCAPEDTLSKTTEVVDDVEISSRKRKRKKKKHQKNREPKNAALRSLRWHKRYLTKKGFYDPQNLLEAMPLTPSFSFMHSLKDGFEIVMYSGSHRVNFSPRLCLHRASAIRIILAEWMMIIWHESLFHAGAKSRSNNTQDMRFFSYVWPDNDSVSSDRTKGTTDGVARENGDQVYRKDITNKICPDMYKALPRCNCCRQDGITLDLRDIPANSYNPGAYIIGDLDEYGWKVVRGVRVNDVTYKAIDYISRFGVKKECPVKNPKWYPIEDQNNNRVMKYNHLSTVHKTWLDNVHTRSFLSELENVVLEKALEIDPDRPTSRVAAKYVLGRYNLLKNKGYISVDQQAHTDYRERVVT